MEDDESFEINTLKSRPRDPSATADDIIAQIQHYKGFQQQIVDKIQNPRKRIAAFAKFQSTRELKRRATKGEDFEHILIEDYKKKVEDYKRTSQTKYKQLMKKKVGEIIKKTKEDKQQLISKEVKILHLEGQLSRLSFREPSPEPKPPVI